MTSVADCFEEVISLQIVDQNAENVGVSLGHFGLSVCYHVRRVLLITCHTVAQDNVAWAQLDWNISCKWMRWAMVRQKMMEG